jgi:hypothetical protein
MEDVREVNDREVERSERDIAQAKHAAKTSGMGAKARLQALQFACVFDVCAGAASHACSRAVNRNRLRRQSACWTKRTRRSSNTRSQFSTQSRRPWLPSTACTSLPCRRDTPLLALIPFACKQAPPCLIIVLYTIVAGLVEYCL